MIEFAQLVNIDKCVYDSFAQYCIDNKLNEHYCNRYLKLIDGCLSVAFDDDQLFHVHHIVPKSWNKSLAKEQSNLIKIPIRYHVVAHHILAKIGDSKMRSAFARLVKQVKRDDRSKTLNYNRLFKQAATLLGRPVVDLNARIVYETAKQAGAAIGIVGGVDNYIRTKSKAKQHYFQYLDIVQQTSIEQQLQLMIDNATENRKKITRSIAKPVIDVDSGVEYESSYEADRMLGWKRGLAKIYILRKQAYRGVRLAFKSDVEQYGLDHVKLTIRFDHKPNTRTYKVINTTTGVVYDSVKQAATAYDVLPDRIHSALRSKTRCKGCYWEKA